MSEISFKFPRGQWVNLLWLVTPKVTQNRRTVYPKKYAHGFVVLCFVVVTQSFIMNSHEVFIHIHQGCFAGTGAIVRLSQCQWSKPDGYGKISQCITTTKHSKAKTVCIFLGIYCIGSGNGLLLGGTKPFPEPRLTYHQWIPVTNTWGQFHKRCLIDESLKSFKIYLKSPRDQHGAVSIRKTVLLGMAIPMLKIRRPNGRLIFNMEITIRR